MRVLCSVAILLATFTLVRCSGPINGTCKGTKFSFCDWAGWSKWTNCTNQCGQGTQERKRFICCPPEYNASTILTCVEKLCSHSLSDYTENKTCVSRAHCQGSSTKSSGGANTVRPSNSKTTGTPLGTNGPSHLSGNNTADTQSKSGPDGGVIAGALVGVLALAGLSSLLLFFLYRRWKKKKEESKVEPETKGDPNSTTNPTQQKSAPVPA
ncbi:uncharacterized protein LOC134253636 isoform X2 [Saccostrea cucullata]|uniref:uncharacterized protein LOC134253636 isoform X2 n=1 Tax=Saccostrea cuccullata TaxID=36930 RepID=UPI002ED48E64